MLPTSSSADIHMDKVRPGVVSDSTLVQPERQIAKFGGAGSWQPNIDGPGLHVEAVQGNAMAMAPQVCVAPWSAVSADQVNLRSRAARIPPTHKEGRTAAGHSGVLRPYGGPVESDRVRRGLRERRSRRLCIRRPAFHPCACGRTANDIRDSVAASEVYFTVDQRVKWIAAATKGLIRCSRHQTGVLSSLWGWRKRAKKPKSFGMWWPGTELNRRRQPFQGYFML